MPLPLIGFEPPAIWIPPKPAIIRSVGDLNLPPIHKAILPGMSLLAAGQSAMPSIAHVGTPTPSGSDASTYTFTSAIPSKAYDWVAVIAVLGGGTDPDIVLASSGVAGVIPTFVVGAISASAGSHAQIILAEIPASTSGNLVIVYDTTATRCAPVVFEMLNVSNLTPHDTLTASGVDPLTGTIDIPANGVALGCAICGDGTSAAWTGLTEVQEGLVETSRRYTTAIESGMAAETGRTITCDWGGTSSFENMAVASWA